MNVSFPRAAKIVLICVAGCPLMLPGQTPLVAATLAMTNEAREASALDLPDAPSYTVAGHGGQDNLAFRLKLAPKYANTIEPEYEARPLGVGGKVALAATELISWHYTVGSVIGAGISHADNSDPKYGTNAVAFGKRVGAAAARGAGQIVLTHAVLAPMLRVDPRYYVLGSGHSVFARIGYAASRVVVTRTDSGNATFNFVDLGGYAGSAALTQLYYPVGDRGRDVMFKAYGLSLVGLAIDNEVAEFVRFLAHKQPR